MDYIRLDKGAVKWIYGPRPGLQPGALIRPCIERCTMLLLIVVSQKFGRFFFRQCSLLSGRDARLRWACGSGLTSPTPLTPSPFY
jgi:hypothetical protein